MLLTKVWAFLLKRVGSIGLSGGTVPSVEPGFGTLSLPCGPWQGSQFCWNMVAPSSTLPMTKEAASGRPCGPVATAGVGAFCGDPADSGGAGGLLATGPGATGFSWAMLKRKSMTSLTCWSVTEVNAGMIVFGSCAFGFRT